MNSSDAEVVNFADIQRLIDSTESGVMIQNAVGVPKGTITKLRNANYPLTIYKVKGETLLKLQEYVRVYFQK